MHYCDKPCKRRVRVDRTLTHRIRHCLLKLMVVMMLTYQPLIIRGIENLASAKTNAYGALFTFVVSFGVSVFYLIQNRVLGGSTDGRQRRRGDENHEYAGIPINSTMLQERNSLDLDLPRSVQEGIFS
jgi:hypothetical protein